MQGWTRARDKGKITSNAKSANLSNLEDAEFQFFHDCPMRNESNAESSVDGGLDGFGGIEIHHAAEGFELKPGFFESGMHDPAGT